MDEYKTADSKAKKDPYRTGLVGHDAMPMACKAPERNQNKHVQTVDTDF